MSLLMKSVISRSLCQVAVAQISVLPLLQLDASPIAAPLSSQSRSSPVPPVGPSAGSVRGLRGNFTTSKVSPGEPSLDFSPSPQSNGNVSVVAMLREEGAEGADAALYMLLPQVSPGEPALDSSPSSQSNDTITKVALLQEGVGAFSSLLLPQVGRGKRASSIAVAPASSSQTSPVPTATGAALRLQRSVTVNQVVVPLDEDVEDSDSASSLLQQASHVKAAAASKSQSRATGAASVAAPPARSLRSSQASPVSASSGSSLGLQRGLTMSKVVLPAEEDEEDDVATSWLQEASHATALAAETSQGSTPPLRKEGGGVTPGPVAFSALQNGASSVAAPRANSLQPSRVPPVPFSAGSTPGLQRSFVSSKLALEEDDDDAEAAAVSLVQLGASFVRNLAAGPPPTAAMSPLPRSAGSGLGFQLSFTTSRVALALEEDDRLADSFALSLVQTGASLVHTPLAQSGSFPVSLSFGSALGLQRSMTISKTVLSLEEEDEDASTGAVSLLQAGASLVTTPFANPPRPSSPSPVPLTSGSALGLQRNLTVSRVALSLEEDDEDVGTAALSLVQTGASNVPTPPASSPRPSASSPVPLTSGSALGLQRSLTVSRAALSLEEDDEDAGAVALSFVQTGASNAPIAHASSPRQSWASPVPLSAGSALGLQRSFTIGKVVLPLLEEDDDDADTVAVSLIQERATVIQHASSHVGGAAAGRLGMQLGVSREQVVLPGEEGEDASDVFTFGLQRSITVTRASA